MSDNKMATVSLDMDLNDIEDFPQYLQLPTGGYLCVLKDGITTKDIVGKDGANPVFEMAFTVKEVLDVQPSALNADEGEEMPKPGDIATFVFQRNNQFGMGLFKEVVKPIAKHLGNTQIGALLEGSKGLECLLIVERKHNKDKNKDYSSIKKLQVA